MKEAVATGVQTACQCCVFRQGEQIADVAVGSFERGGLRHIDSRALFPICSTGKAFLSVAALRLCDRGLFSMDDPISKFWPELNGAGREAVTFREVMGHRAGFVPEFPDLPREAMSDWDAMARRCAESPMLFPHGTQAAYLALTYTWYLGHPIVCLTGKPLARIIEDEVLAPCGIREEAIFGGCREAQNRVVTVYDTPRPSDWKPPRPPPCLPELAHRPPRRLSFEQMNRDCRVPACVPAGHAVASAHAIATLFAKLPRLVSPDFLREVARPNGPPSRENETTYGLGLRLWGPADDRGRILGHSGFGGSEGWYDRETEIAFGYTCACDATDRRPPCDLRGRLYEILGVRPNVFRPHSRTR